MEKEELRDAQEKSEEEWKQKIKSLEQVCSELRETIAKQAFQMEDSLEQLNSKD